MLKIHLDLNGTILPFDSTKGNEFDLNTKIEHHLNTTVVKYTNVETCLEETMASFVSFGEAQNDCITLKEWYSQTYDKETRHLKSRSTRKNHSDIWFISQAFKKLDETVKPLLASFIKLVGYLLESSHSFVILFRTFGTDYELLKDLIKEYVPQLNKLTWRENVPNDHSTLRSELEKAELDPSSRQVWFVQDNWKRWNANNETSEFGKDFPVMENSWFFDDNENIVNSRDEKGNFILNANNIHVVNTFDVIVNENYFVDLIK